jgi:hypothetical protein
MSNSESDPQANLRESPGKFTFSNSRGEQEIGECTWRTDGSIVTNKSTDVVELDLSGRTLNHKLEVNLESGSIFKLEAGHGLPLFESFVKESNSKHLSPEVCGTCRFFKRSGMINQWSFGFEGYCRVDSDLSDPTFSNVFQRCDRWAPNPAVD